MMLTSKPKIGDRVLCLTHIYFGETKGKIYEIVGYDNGGDAQFVNDFGDLSYMTKYGYRNYALVEFKPSASDRITALETEVATLKAKVDALEQAKTTTVHNVTINPMVNTAETASNIAKAFAELSSEYAQPRSLTPNERRADVIKRAKAFVCGGYDRWYGNKLCNVEFIVNSEKRAVVALLRGKRDTSVVSKGIAKCDPSDVFNADIGKAIALGRALGVDVTEFERAVQPTEVVVGHAICALTTCGKRFDYTRVTDVSDNKAFNECGEFVRLNAAEHHGKLATNPKITDDTDAVYG